MDMTAAQTSCSAREVVKGRVVKKIEGGLLVDIGVHAFLPAQQVWKTLATGSARNSNARLSILTKKIATSSSPAGSCL